ncbi:Adenylate isopentenyltransferase [Capsicum baccatum]|uniref:Adenylate isopentenyltransferase n=1 Tax=Capsicum baccatum TaxID=33114 RepID=A0A2G2WHN5_CAPBA|nr:Adenylate isopentenyltransferase [Capsicum baccatum]
MGPKRPMDATGHHWHHGWHKHQRHTMVPCTKEPSTPTAGALRIRHPRTTITTYNCGKLRAPRIKLRILRKMNISINNIIKSNKNKVVFILGATGTGKSRLSVDLATHFSAEIINSDKMQVYKGLDIVTNKITDSEKQGLVDEVREIFSPAADYSKGIRRSIGVPEMDKYFREENKFDACEESMKKMLLESAVKEIKVNTCNLVRRQHEKIKRFMNEKMWSLHYVDATNVFKENEKEGVDDKWKHDVLKPCLDIVKEFLK